MDKILLFLLVITLSSCALLKGKDETYATNYKREMGSEDYAKHLEAITKKFVDKNKKKIRKISSANDPYIKYLVDRISQNNEIVISKNKKVDLYIVEDRRPFYFSMPEGNIFISSQMFIKYFKSEDIFISAFTSEFAKSTLWIYQKQILIPREDYKIESMIKFARLPFIEKVKLNNLSYEMMKRSGYDPAAQLLWLQTQNRNTIDFSFMYEVPSEMAREEFYLKNYIVSKGDESSITYERNSSRMFYNLKQKIEKAYE
ncbi:hypothetical protein [Bacteriovorax sp. Seq25_V]|uniref:hypothetical protein n=1 Tax=Bacteriovorax sp. Seq25_V TaxID=1201288 RepID=UPI00038A519C|nr:hypothetical protein [Bacteriovorax sp. Seq25_V]EQC43331.1 hypothetical protein M900_2774 [Bacteriovorax sp. Seq25_V]